MVHSRKYLELDYTWKFTTAYIPAEHRQNTGYIFLVKYTYVYSLKIVYTSTFKNKQKSTQPKSFLLHFWSSNLKMSHLCKFNFLTLLKFGKYETTNKTLFIHFPCCLSYGCTTHHSPGMNRKVRATRLISQPCLEHCGFCISSGCKLDRNDTARWPTGRYTGSQNS